MYLKIKGTKINIDECSNFKNRFKSFKFYLEKIEHGLYFPKKKVANTYFFCQRVDICFTDNTGKIIYLYRNMRSEKLIFKFKAKNVFYLPLGCADKLKIGNVLTIYNEQI